MDFVQVDYSRTMVDGLPGSLNGINDYRALTFIAGEDMPFGRVISARNTAEPRTAGLGGGTIAATAGYLQGNPTVATISALNAITNGGISITIDGTARSLTALDFSSAVNYAGVAAVINTALSTYGSCTFDPDTMTFRVTSATTGASSAVTVIADVATYTSVIEALGFGGTPERVAGKDSFTAQTLGISIRSVTVESGLGAKSGEPVVKTGDVGAYLSEGDIKVLLREDCTAGGNVYFDDATGEIYASSGAGRTQLGSTKFPVSASAGQVITIDVLGVRI